MANEIGTGGGGVVEIGEPLRHHFPDNLGGAIQFTFARWQFWVMLHWFDPIREWAGGIFYGLFERMEGPLLEIATPLIDNALGMPDLPPDIRTFLEGLKAKTHPVGALVIIPVILTLLAPFIGAFLKPWTRLITQQGERHAESNIPDPGALVAMKWRQAISGDIRDVSLDKLGYPDVFKGGFEEIMKPRLDLATLVQAYYRQELTASQVQFELMKRGYETNDTETFIKVLPRFLPVRDDISAYLRGLKTGSELSLDLRQQGYKTDDVDALLAMSWLIPGAQDLIRMAVREAWDDGVSARWGYDAHFPAEFAEWGEKQGLSREWTKRYWRAHWVLPSPLLGYEMLHRGLISVSELDELLRIADYPVGWRGKMIDVAYHPYTRVDVRRMYKVGVLDRNQVYRAYLDLGYNPEKAEGMTVFTEIYSPPEDAIPEDEFKLLSRSIIERAYRVGKLTKAEATTRLMELGYTTEDIELLLSLVEAVAELDDTPDMLGEFRRDMKAIIERAFERRVIGPEEALDMLVDLGFSSNEAEFILLAVNAIYQQKTTESRLSIIGKAYVLRAISITRVYELLGQMNLAGTEQAQIIAEWDVEREVRDRGLTEAQYRKFLTTKIEQIDGWLSAGDITKDQHGVYFANLIEEYSENLRGLGYTEKAIGILIYLAVPETRG